MNGGGEVSAADGGSSKSARFVEGLARGCAGALLFALPMFMTMEMWSLGSYLSREKMLLLLLVNLPLLLVLSHRVGFERTTTWKEAARDAIVAYGIGIVTSAGMMIIMGILKADMPMHEIAGKIALQAVPASIGALLGRSQLGGSSDDEDEAAEAGDEDAPERQTGYVTELFLMAIGALFLSLNVAPTEEMILISYKMSYWHALAAIFLSISIMHGFVYALSFSGGHKLEPDTPWWHGLVRFTMPGYVIALTISLYSLWTFERVGDSAMLTIAMSVIVLGVPAAIGAAAARLIL